MPEEIFDKPRVPKMRDDVIGNAIKQAMKAVSDSSSCQQVWQKLCEYVSQKTPPFLEFDDADIKYLDTGIVKILTKNAVRKRISRSF
jgi:hypothetical protein